VGVAEKDDKTGEWKWQITAICGNGGGYAMSKWQHGGNQSCHD